MDENCISNPKATEPVEGQGLMKISLGVGDTSLSNESQQRDSASSDFAEALRSKQVQTTENASHDTVDPLAKLMELSHGDVFANKYEIVSDSSGRSSVTFRYLIEDERILGKPHVRFAVSRLSQQRVVLKFYSSRETFDKCFDFNSLFSCRYVCKSAQIPIS